MIESAINPQSAIRNDESQIWRAARAGRRPARESRRAGTEAGHAVVQPRRRLRRGLQLAMFRDLERVQTVFTGVAAHRAVGANLAFGGQTMNGDAMLVSGSYFSVLGVRPALGRLIGSGDDRAPGESPVAVLSHAFWQTRFAGDANVLNRTM